MFRIRICVSNLARLGSMTFRLTEFQLILHHLLQLRQCDVLKVGHLLRVRHHLHVGPDEQDVVHLPPSPVGRQPQPPQPASPALPTGFVVGASVMCRYHNMSLGRWHQGKLFMIHPDNTVDVRYDEGQEEYRIPCHHNHIRLVENTMSDNVRRSRRVRTVTCEMNQLGKR